MKSLKRILLAVELDQIAEEAQEAAICLASRFGSEIVPLHVVDQRSRAVPTSRLEEVQAAAAKRLQEVADDLKSRHAAVAPPVVAFGSPYEQIIANAGSLGVNVIVVGAGEPTGGSTVGVTAEQLARRAIRPVWVASAASPREPASILCPIDFSSASRRALRNAVHLARTFEARLTVVHVVETASSWVTRVLTGEDPQDKVEDADAALEQALQPIDHAGVEVESVVLEGKPAQQIVATARERGADLLVMGSVGRTGLDRLFLGSVATRVLRQLPCSMITVKGEHIVRPEFDSKVKSFDERFQRGVELDRGGFSEQALAEFRLCLDESPVSPQVWLAMAKVYEKIGNEEEAKTCRDKAEEIIETIENERIQADIRREHWLYKGGK
jgi:universal stress protein E